MRVANIVSPGKIEVSDKADIPGFENGKVLVRLLRVAICGSDLPYFSNTFSSSSYPMPAGYPGHECLGIVEKSDCSDFKTGDHVMYYPEFLDGYKEIHLANPERLQKLPKSSDIDILIMTQLLGAVSHCVFRLDKPNNKTVVIMGSGPVGLLFTALLKNHGAKNIIVVDPLDYRLETALTMGADLTINPTRQNLVESIYKFTDARLADIVIDAFGQDPEVINDCFKLACHNGQVAFFGICLEESPGLDFNTLFRKELRMIASVGPDISVDYPYALNMILRKVIDVSPVVTHILPFEDIQKGFEIALNRMDRAIKVILKF